MEQQKFKQFIDTDLISEFFTLNRDRLEDETAILCESNDGKRQIGLTCKGGYPTLIVLIDGMEEHSEQYLSQWSIESQLPDLCDQYLSDEAERDDQELEILEREDEINQALADFLTVVLEEDFDISRLYTSDGADFVDEIMELLAINHGFTVRRPMFIVDSDSGEEVFTEYPYDEYDFGEDK